MKVNYRYWEPNQSLEELQVKIYNENNPDGQPVTAQQVIDRYEQEKITPKTVRYAFTEDGELLSYIQARDYPNVEETHLGFPWSSKECPEEVQGKLFDEMLEYIKTREEAKKYAIRMNANADREEIVTFFKKKGLVEKSKSYRYSVDVNEVSKTDYTDKDFSTRLATVDDVDLLVKLLKDDGRLDGQFNSDEEIKNYFKDRVLKDGQEKGNNAVLVFKDETLVMAAAPLIFKIPGDEKESLILRFHSFLPGNEKAFKLLMVEIAKECTSINYGTDKPLSVFIGRSREEEFATVLNEWTPKKKITGIAFGLED
ncbi:MAG: hypothetical protein ACXADY_18645 [Candidatus Hodarchaeales archaeon]|jgi:hypothetical protein